MIAYSKRSRLIAAVCGLMLSVTGLGGAAQGQGLPKLPEAPKVEPPKAPEVPKAPEIPDPNADAKKPAAPKTPMRKVLDHKKQFVIYPRLGYLRAIGASTEGGDISHATVGFDAQVAINRTVYVALEAQLLYLTAGTYGLNFDGTTVKEYAAGKFTSITGAGVGLFTHFLDKQELWTHVSLKAGYLYPFYLPIWVGGDIEKEFRRTRTSYWVFSMAPAIGVMVPIRSPVGRDQYFPPPGTDESEPSPVGVHFFAGAQLSIAFVFAPRT